MTTIRERVVEWLIDHRPGEFTVTMLASELALERRQALNALHGLERGLPDQLVRVGSGMWRWTPTATVQIQSQFGDFKYNGGHRPTTTVPMGWRSEVMVVARVGDHYLVEVLDEHGKPSGLCLLMTPVIGPIERLDNSE